ncbi:uncharacterized protein B0I36DRAFT_328494 [Microdochium trichocladiopsis]|uniref:Uncharacterized protein n=1 Tax=Microdochium trichocladiopsis TaxID=1682393 RepID=A0A9P8Y2R6_9PEZI|nr:uncharacterized protein B0I36DRAFT_328494 [Microdochium trichocladiopsis]KAH7028036.1 hypothetical protein B0I36DRAFT_328494 [Microdochium trichocladiopsis]
MNQRDSALLKAFGAPRFLAKPALTELNGFFGSRTGLGRDHDDRVDSKTIRDCSTWFQVFVKMVSKVPGGGKRGIEPEYVKPPKKDYIWHEMGFYTFWGKQPGQNGQEETVLRILCVDTPDDMPESIKALLDEHSGSQGGLELNDPFALHSALLDKIIVLQDVAVWRVRDQVRVIEKSRDHTSVGKRFETMHEIGRHGIHMSEVLEVSANTINSLLEYQKTVYKKTTLSQEYTMQAEEYMKFQLTAIKSLKLRSASNDKRLENEIALAFNRIAQSDNTVVKSIAVLTMFFLPSTFVSAIFSTSFFGFQDSGWAMSDKFWIFWAVAIPATALMPIYMLFAFKKPRKAWEALAVWKKKRVDAVAAGQANRADGVGV